MAWPSQTIKELIEQVEKDFSARFFGTSAPLRRSVMKTLARIWAGITFLQHLLLEWIYRNGFAHLCDSDQVALHGIPIGVYHNGGGYASGFVLVTGGTPGETIEQDTIIHDPKNNEVKYRVVDDYEIPAEGELDIEVTALSYGFIYNQLAGVELEFEDTPTDWDAIVTVDADGIEGGDDAEDPEDYRDRVLYKKRNPPQGGAESDYVIKATSYPNVTNAYITEGFPQANNVQVVLVDMDKVEYENIPPTVSATDVARVQSGMLHPSWKPLTSVPVVQSCVVTNVNVRLGILPYTASTEQEAIRQVKSLLARKGHPNSVVTKDMFSSYVGEGEGIESVEIIFIRQDGVEVNELVVGYAQYAWPDVVQIYELIPG